MWRFRLPSCSLFLHLALLVALGFLPACSSRGKAKLYRVSGRVTLNGQPVPTGTISFRPDLLQGNGTNHHPTGPIDAQGRFELYTVGKKGAPLGWYKVLIFADANAAPGGKSAHPVPPKWLIPAKYTNEKRTDLSIEVIANPDSDYYTFALKP